MSPARVALKHISRFRDRHGHLRHYLRLPGRKAVPLPGAPGSPEFMHAYQAAIEAAATDAEALPAAPKVVPGSLDALALSYYAAPAYTDLRASTRAAYRRIVEELRASHGRHPVKMLDAQGVRMLLAAKDRPTAANHRLRLIRALVAHAIAMGWLAQDPTSGVKRRRYQTDGFTTWTEADIAAYEARHPSGTQARLALALLLYTGQRRSDVIRMGRQHITPAGIEIRQVKTLHQLTVPRHSALDAELAQVPPDRLIFLVNDNQRPWKSAGAFYNQFKRWVAEAGLPADRAPHGLRKGCGRRLAEAGATTHQIMAILGVSLKTAEIYTRAAEQVRLAVAGMARIENITSNPAEKVGNPDAK